MAELSANVTSICFWSTFPLVMSQERCCGPLAPYISPGHVLCGSHVIKDDTVMDVIFESHHKKTYLRCF